MPNGSTHRSDHARRRYVHRSRHQYRRECVLPNAENRCLCERNVNIAVGSFTGWSGAITDDASSFGILYGVSTFGSEDRNFSAGIGYAYYNDEVANSPLVLGGFKLRLSRGTAFISENYVLPAEEGGLVSFGLRFFGERIAGDVGLIRYVGRDDADQGLGFPFVGLAVKLR